MCHVGGARMTSAIARATAFLFGFGFALLPAVGPFLAILLFLSARLRPVWSDTLWAGAGLLLAVSPAAHGNLGVAASSLLQIAAGWLIYKAFANLAPSARKVPHAASVGVGLLVGLALVIGLNLLRVEAWNFGTAKTIAQAIVWESSPALFGHTVLVLGGLIAVVSRALWVRTTALGLAGAGILLTGSTEAGVGWIFVAVVLTLTHRSHGWRRHAAALALVAAGIAAATGLGPAVGWGSVGFVVEPAPGDGDGNLLQGTELPFGDWWDRSWVSVESYQVRLDAAELTAYRVRKDGSEAWLRLQQSVELLPGGTYTVSAWMTSTAPDARPGIQGWGQLMVDGGVQPFVVTGSLRNGEWSASASGPGVVLDQGVAAVDGAWSRPFVTFEYVGDEPISWFVGLAPDNRDVDASVATFAGFQLERGSLNAYTPGTATRGLDAGVARFPLWQAAWNGIQERPWIGLGADVFPSYYLSNWPERNRLHVVPAHAHNLYLHTWFERGAIGVLGILALLAALATVSIRRGDIPLLTVLAATIFANVFDTTLLYGGVFYPLAAVAGWRAGHGAGDSPAATAAAHGAMSRLGLAAADAAAVLAAFVIATWSTILVGPAFGFEANPAALPTAALYAILLWPLLSWREGLYPGYGLTPQQELKKQATTCLHAGLLLTAALVLVPGLGRIPPLLLVLTWVGTFLTLPAARALAKRALLGLGYWGRPVVILGAGATGSRVARALQRTPLDGLHPRAFFDDDTHLHGSSIHGVPVVGFLADADAWARIHNVAHAIVAIPGLHADRLRTLLDTQGRHFRAVQHIPNLAGFPAEDVFASSLDGMLAIEVRNNLAARRNRWSKRAIDLVGSLALLTLLSPLLLVLGLWVRLDSRGPVLYRSERVGQEGRDFRCLKFRTMVEDADRALEDLIAADPSLREEYERFHKLDDDPRTTRAGRFLRAYSLDELPQLFNVLTGSMSLVGPRPYLKRELPLMHDFSDIILQAKPGMTGYWQVSERNDVTFRDRLEMEAHYVRNWSIWWDVVILVRTVPAVLEKRGK